MIFKTPQYDTILFRQTFESPIHFKCEYKSSGLYDEDNCLDDKHIILLYNLLFGRFANDPIANLDINQFKLRLFTIIFQYGPTWQKKLAIQNKLRELSEAEVLNGTTAIYNHAFNPENAPTTQTKTELEYINEQNVTKYDKPKIEAYTALWQALSNDVTGAFLQKFEPLFKKFITPEKHLLFVTEEEEEDD